MDKNAITAVVLMSLLTIVYLTYWSSNAPPPPKPAAKTVDSTSAGTSTTTPSDVTTAPTEITREMLTDEQKDSVKQAKLQRDFGGFAHLVEGEGEVIQVKTEKLTVNIQTKGGAIQSAYLNEYQTFDSLALPVIDDHPNNAFYFDFYDKEISRGIKSSDLVFTPSKQDINLSGTDSAQLVLTAQINEEEAIQQIYTFRGNTYDVDYRVRLQGLKEHLKETYFTIYWTSYLPKTELSIDNMRQKTTVAYRQGRDVEKLSPTDEPTEQKIGTSFDWLSYKSQFFSQILMAETPFRSGKVEMRTPVKDDYCRVMESKMRVDIRLVDDIQSNFTFYLGPNEYSTLRSYDKDLQDEMDLGWWFISFINVGTTYIFKFLEGFISNYGIIIILLALLIRTLVFPLTYKSYMSMGKMRVLNQTPEMKALDEKYKGDPQKLQMAKMGIYREMGVSMFGGCLPMLLSYPFLIALFFFFPQSVELRQQSFLWANDLSTYDSILQLPFEIPAYGDHISLFTLLMAISTLVYAYYQQKSQPTSAANPALKYIPYFMPIVLLIFLNNYASGLSLYYFTSNLISISQTLLIRRFIDDDKLLAQMKETQKQMKGKKGKAKKGKGRLEKWVENQQKKQKQAMKQRQQTQGKNRSARRNK